MSKGIDRKRTSKTNVSRSILVALFIGLGVLATAITYQALQSPLSLRSTASVGSRYIAKDWHFTTNGLGWNFICADYRVENNRFLIVVPNPDCPAPQTIERTLSPPINLPTGNKYFTMELGLTKKPVVQSRSLVSNVLGTTNTSMSFGALMEQFRKLIGISIPTKPPVRITPTPTPPSGCTYQKVLCVKAPCDPILVCTTPNPKPTSTPGPTSKVTPTIKPTSIPPGTPTSTPLPNERLPILVSYRLNGKTTWEQPLTLHVFTDGQIHTEEAKFPEIDGINIAELKIDVESVTRTDLELELRVISLESDTQQTDPTPTSVTKKEECIIGGCSGELCLEESTLSRVGICIYREEFRCYKEARCEKQANNSCGWTLTDEYKACRNSLTPTPIVVETTCTDSDGGNNYYQKGTTIGNAADETLTQREDTCRPKNYYGDGYEYVMEYFCHIVPQTGKYYATNTNQKCQNGCVDGACVGTPGMLLATIHIGPGPGPCAIEESCYTPYYPQAIPIYRKDDDVLWTSVVTNEKGTIETQLPPGAYYLSFPNVGIGAAKPSREFTITSNQTTTLQINLDSGMR